VSEAGEPITLTGTDAHLVVIAAVRYAMGRRTYVVGAICRWLRGIWSQLPVATRAVIQRDLEEEYAREERLRAIAAASGREHRHVLGAACDVAEWDQVRALWEGADTHQEVGDVPG